MLGESWRQSPRTQITNVGVEICVADFRDLWQTLSWTSSQSQHNGIWALATDYDGT